MMSRRISIPAPLRHRAVDEDPGSHVPPFAEAVPDQRSGLLGGELVEGDRVAYLGPAVAYLENATAPDDGAALVAYGLQAVVETPGPLRERRLNVAAMAVLELEDDHLTVHGRSRLGLSELRAARDDDMGSDAELLAGEGDHGSGSWPGAADPPPCRSGDLEESSAAMPNTLERGEPGSWVLGQFQVDGLDGSEELVSVACPHAVALDAKEHVDRILDGIGVGEPWDESLPTERMVRHGRSSMKSGSTDGSFRDRWWYGARMEPTEAKPSKPLDRGMRRVR